MPFYLIISLLIFIYYVFYLQQTFDISNAEERKHKIFELLKKKYQGLKENDLGFFEYSTNSKNILFGYKTYRSKTITNILKVYLDISTVEEDIKNLCKIHFNCTNIDDRDWVEMPVEVLFDTLNNLAKKSSKTVTKIISETDFYISQKREERGEK